MAWVTTIGFTQQGFVLICDIKRWYCHSIGNIRLRLNAEAHQTFPFASIIARRQRRGQRLQRRDGVTGTKTVHMRQHLADATGTRRKAIPAQQWVQPDQAAA